MLKRKNVKSNITTVPALFLCIHCTHNEHYCKIVVQIFVFAMYHYGHKNEAIPITYIESFSGSQYELEFQRSIHQPEEYWAKIAEDVVWTKKWDKVLDDSASPFTKWFVGGRLSLCFNAVDRHVDEGRGGQKALVWDSPITGGKSQITYAELKSKVRLIFPL